MGKLMLLLVMAATLSSMLLHGNVQETISKADERFVEHGSTMLAREIAMTGMNDALQEASGQFSSGSYSGNPDMLNGTFDGGTYNVTLESEGSGVVITSVGTFGEQQYTVERFYDNIVSGGVPPFMNNSVTCAGDITIQNDLLMFSVDPTKNADMHANGSLTFDVGSSYVQGFGFYGGSMALNNGQTAEDIFQPNVNPSSDPVHQQVDIIDFPMFDASAYAGIATETTFGDLIMDMGFYSMGTEEDPMIWYVAGDVWVNLPTFFSGYGVIVATGDINIMGDIYTTGALESTLGLYAEGNISTLMPYLTVEGQWFAGGDIVLDDNINFTGSYSSASAGCNFLYTLNMTYRPASEALTVPFWSPAASGAGGLQLAEAREW